MRRARPLLLALAVLVTAVLSGCGGNQITADEVPVQPPTITIPQSRDAGPGTQATTAGEDTGTSDTNEDAQADATATAAPSGGTPPETTGGTTTDPGQGTGATGGGAAEPQAPAEDPAATGGAGADEGLDQFCADNPGAC